MPRPARPLAQRWADILNVLLIPAGIYELVEDHVMCLYCTVKLNCITEANISRHHNSKLHQTNTALQIGRSETSEDAKDECTSKTHAFFYDMAEAFMAADIPFEKLNNDKFVRFLENYMKRKIPEASTLRKTYADLVYSKKIQDVRDEVGDNPIYLSVDETNDTQGRFITLAIIAPLISDCPGIPRMIHCAEVPVGNANEICMFVEQSLTILWSNGIRREKVLLFVSDAAPYMMAAGQTLKTNYGYRKLVHVSCLAHGLHRVAEDIRGTYRLTNDVIPETKAVFVKSPRRKHLFNALALNIPLPPQPVITRWGEWLNAATYYHNHFLEVQRVIEALEQDAAAVERAKELWIVPNLENEFRSIHENYHIITEVITRLEGRGMTLEKSINNITEVGGIIQGNMAISINIRDKMYTVLLNNTGFSIDLINIYQVLQGVQNVDIPDGWTIEDVHSMTYAPTTSCETERSFSGLKNILRSTRQSFTVQNLAKFVIVYFNQIELIEENL